MEHKGIVASVVVLALIITGMFVFAFLKRAEIEEAKPTQITEVVDSDSPYKNITRIDAKHYYITPRHTIVGEIIMPTPCDLLNWSTRSGGVVSNQVTVDFEVINHAESCADVITPQRFSVPFDADEDALITATFNGRTVDLNLVPALQGEVPEDFELFIKG
ncbi:MAG: hypothetical protein K9M10_01955 [Candidatus Pacebacteria bacterium]|nr:hypothetical protein [Candidatus Paceibacterota bacterium]MCF7857228.1 hypothetical protein [Candidatus Paceibacterota bacterium]